MGSLERIPERLRIPRMSECNHRVYLSAIAPRDDRLAVSPVFPPEATR